MVKSKLTEQNTFFGKEYMDSGKQLALSHGDRKGGRMLEDIVLHQCNRNCMIQDRDFAEKTMQISGWEWESEWSFILFVCVMCGHEMNWPRDCWDRLQLTENE